MFTLIIAVVMIVLTIKGKDVDWLLWVAYTALFIDLFLTPFMYCLVFAPELLRWII